MVFGKLIRIMMFVIIGFVIYFRDHYYLIIIVGIVFLAYKLDLHNKIYNLINKLSGNTRNVVVDRNKKTKYLKKLSKYSRGEI